MVCPQGWNGVQILSFDMLKNLLRASVLVFTRRRTLNPKTLDDRESSMLQSGQTTGSVRNIISRTSIHLLYLLLYIYLYHSISTISNLYNMTNIQYIYNNKSNIYIYIYYCTYIYIYMY